jgi:hypothetical protein
LYCFVRCSIVQCLQRSCQQYTMYCSTHCTNNPKNICALGLPTACVQLRGHSRLYHRQPHTPAKPWAGHSYIPKGGHFLSTRSRLVEGPHIACIPRPNGHLPV